MKRLPLPEHFSGCLLGQCLGDALGAPVEAKPPEVCARYVDEELRKGRAGERGRPPYAFGQYTDDSQLARELMESWLARDGFDAADYARRICAIFAEGRIVGQGRSTRLAADRLAAGVPWDEAGTPPPAAGNGSAMRAAPVGLFYFDDPEELVRVAHDQGRITHKDPRCSAGAVAIAAATALALDEGPIDKTMFLAILSEMAGQLDAGLGASLLEVEGWLALTPDGAAAAALHAGGGDAGGWQGISPFVVPSVLYAIYAFLRSPEDYWETICTAIAPGGDVDTVAAMAGAIAGAHVGEAGLPAALVERLQDQGKWRAAELKDLAVRCYGSKMGWPPNG